ncbi:c-type cytochrome [Croceibacterium aestuarii]|uniref:c-type cytochrome n=1 Tax=Croceibacterium aestuarii TaxID=3064139 RepID=UPI00272DFE5B|nr:c-type cytochrome [Croceibacterium sp. D39]
MRKLVALALIPLAACAGGRDDDTTELAKQVIADHCGLCHTVPGVIQAHGKVGPNLEGIGRREVIAGKLPNSRPNLLRWITHAQTIAPGSAMPDIPLTPEQANAVADYLYSLD